MVILPHETDLLALVAQSEQLYLKAFVDIQNSKMVHRESFDLIEYNASEQEQVPGGTTKMSIGL
jgi:hypothetical protein